MSNYFRTLNRLVAEGEARAVSRPAAAPLYEVPAPPEAEEETAEPLRPVTNLITYPGTEPGEPPPAYAGLLDSLRVLVHERQVPAVVIAGACGGGAVSRVVKGLAVQARRTGLRLLVAEPGRAAGHPSLDGPDSALPGVQSWLERSGSGHDLVILEGPPLDGSVEAVLLAKACDGLLIVVESGVTPAASLAKGVELAATAGCRLLGVVMTGARPWLPSWIRRLVATPK